MVQGPNNATFLVLSGKPLGEAAQAALVSCAEALGHKTRPMFATVEECDRQQLVLLVHQVDPWSVAAVDDDAIAALKHAFAEEAAGFAPDAPVIARGYQLVAVPGFEACMDDLPAKRVAWKRLKIAQHPASPL